MTPTDTANEVLPNYIYQALEEGWAGASGSSVESDVLELKEDPSRLPQASQGA